VTVAASSVRTALEALVTRMPSLKSHVIDDSGHLQPYVNLFVDNQQITDLDSDAVALKNDSELLIVSALAGG